MEAQLTKQIHDFGNRVSYDGEAIACMTKEGNWIIIQSRGIQTDLTTGRWGGIVADLEAYCTQQPGPID